MKRNDKLRGEDTALNILVLLYRTILKFMKID